MSIQNESGRNFQETLNGPREGGRTSTGFRSLFRISRLRPLHPRALFFCLFCELAQLSIYSINGMNSEFRSQS